MMSARAHWGVIGVGFVVASLLQAPAARAAGLIFPTGTLEFLQPSGTVGPNDIIPVDVRFTLTSGAGGFNPDPSDGLLWGLDPDQDFIVDNDITEIQDIFNITYRVCGDTFLGSSGNVCNGGPYADSGGNTFQLFDWLADSSRQIGDHIDLTWMNLTPKAPPIAGGLYTLGNIGFEYGLHALDSDDEPAFGMGINGPNYGSIIVGSTCPSGSPSCTFTREVLAPVPLPAAAWLLMSGLGAMGALARRRRKTTAT